MKELMKGPNERGREDSKNTISDDLEARHQPWWRLVRVGPPKFIKLPTPWVTELWYWHKHNWRMSLAIYSIMWLCASKKLFQKTHELQPLGWKITFSGEETPPPPQTLQLLHTIPHKNVCHTNVWQPSVISAHSV